jgi:hypothetical protein
MDEWEDLAMFGHQTLLGRIASCNDPSGLSPADLWGNGPRSKLMRAIHGATQEDIALMQDPAYRKRVSEAINGKTPGSAYFSADDRNEAIYELHKVFDGTHSQAEVAKKSAPSLHDVVTECYGDSALMSALSNAKPQDWTNLEPLYQERIQNQINNMQNGPREEAQQLLDRLKRGEAPSPGFSETLRMDALTKKSPQDILKQIYQERKNNPKTFDGLKNGSDPQLDHALHEAFPKDYDTMVKPLIENGTVPLTALSSLYKGKDFYDNLNMVSTVEKNDIVDLSKRADQNDANAKRLLSQKLPGLSAEQAHTVAQVLSNKDRVPTTADKIHELSIGEKLDSASLVNEFSHLSSEQKKQALSEYSNKYHSDMIADWSAKAPDERSKNDIQAALPIDLREQYRIHQNQTEQQSTDCGIYGDMVPTEQSIEATNQMMKYNMAHMSPEKRQQLTEAEDKLQQFFQDSQQKLRDNRMSKDEYTRQVTDQIMNIAYLAAAPATGGASLTPMMCAIAASAIAHPMIERALRGEPLNAEEFKSSLESGMINGTLAFCGMKQLQTMVGGISRAVVGESIEQAGLSSVTPALRQELETNLSKQLEKTAGGKVLDEKTIEQTVVPPELRGKPEGQKLAQEIAKELPAKIENETRDAVQNEMRAEAPPVLERTAAVEPDPYTKLFTPEELERIEKQRAIQQGYEKVNITKEDANKIADQVLAEQRAGKTITQGNPPRLDIVIGPPGAGKSQYLIPKLEGENGSVLVDPDEVKPKVPGYHGYESGEATHTASSKVAIALRDKAFAEKDNVIWSTMGNDPKVLEKVIADAKKKGYEVNIHYANVPPEVSARRAYNRAFGENATGQYVDPRRAYDTAKQIPDSYKALKNNPNVNSWEEIDMDVPQGQQPEVIDSGSKPPKAA